MESFGQDLISLPLMYCERVKNKLQAIKTVLDIYVWGFNQDSTRLYKSKSGGIPS